jgi:uncharacterized protein (TIGR03790 family)
LLLVYNSLAAATTNPLASRVLIVYASNDANSSAVANYYQSRRAIPGANMCPIAWPLPNAPNVLASDWANTVQPAIQACLNSAGPQNILYIVLAYVRPYVLNSNTGLGSYALDSYIADIWNQYAAVAFDPVPTRTHPYYQDDQSQGNVFAPFQSFAQFRKLPTLPLFYSVWRLDGASVQLAEALVDNAIAAEAAGGPVSQVAGSLGNACIDMATDPSNWPDTGYRSADWDLLRASQALSLTNNFSVITDTNSTTFGTPPSPNCPNTSLYAGWYNYGTYNNAFSWNAGSIGWDLDSGALADPRNGPFWGGLALQHGLTVTTGPAGGEPYLEGLTRPPGAFRDLLQGANVGDAFLRNTRWLKWMIEYVGDPLYTPFPSALPPFNSPVAANSMSFNPREAVGPTQVAVVLTLATPAPSGGEMLNLSSNNSALSVPASVMVPGGMTTATFVANATALPATAEIIVTASNASVSVANTFVLDPLLGGLGFEANSVKGGQSMPAAVFLNASAPIGGITVQLSTDQPNVSSVPASVYVPEGLSEADFVVTTYPVASNTTVNITASYGGGSQQASLTVTP